MSRYILYGGVFLFFLVTFTVIYSPVIQNGFFYGTDYLFFGVEVQPKHKHIAVIGSIARGRVLEEGFYTVFSNYIQSSEDTKTIHLLSIIGITLIASVIFVLLRRCSFRIDHAFLMSMLICTLPSFQVLAAWTIVIPNIYSALLSSLSALLLFNSMSKDKETNRTITGKVILSTIFLLVIAFNINQPPAMIYWAMGIIYFLAGNNCDLSKKRCRLHVIIFFGVGLFSMMIYYFIFIKIIPVVLKVSYGVGRASTIDIGHIPLKIKWFLSSPFKAAINLWNIYPNYTFAFFIGVIILFGITFNIIQRNENKKVWFTDYLPKYFLILFLIVLSYLPNLLVQENAYPYRTIVSLATALTILFCFGIINVVEFFKLLSAFSVKVRKAFITIVLTILTFFTAFSAHSNVNSFVMRHSNELDFIKNTIRETELSYISKIYVRRPRLIQARNPAIEFEKQISTYSDSLVPLVVKQALHELDIKQDIEITQGSADDPVTEDVNVLVIDMMKLIHSSKIL